MRRLTPYLNLMCILCAILFLTVTMTANASQDSEKAARINSIIAKSGANWTAGESWITQLSKEERLSLCGTIIDRAMIDKSKYRPVEIQQNLPIKFDWRNHNGGNWVTPVKNQGSCGSCWDFAAIGQIEAWWRISNSRLDSVIDLSEQFVLSCSPGSCNGYTVEGAFDFIEEVGVPPEACMYYNGLDAFPCSRACADWEEKALKIKGWSYITLDFDDVDNIKSALLQQPVAGSYVVYEDFMYYTGGVYEHVWGEVEAGHAVLIVGWDDEDECWICKNSWGPNWGEDGYFRIRWGDSGMGEFVPFLWDEVINQSNIYVAPLRLNIQMKIGDTATKQIELFNFSDEMLQYSAVSSEVQAMFHPNEFTAFDDQSWWCGDTEIMGYSDHWLQYLESPALDLSGTEAPILTWMGKWTIESPAGATPPYDGWDGCNVWVSVDGGTSFKILEPNTPPYNCRSMWSFGHPEQGWNMGEGIAGWAGESKGWTNIEMDLSQYKADSVVVRFAFASDMGLSTLDDPGLIGFFVDEIRISDGSTLIFENSSSNPTAMTNIAISPSDVSSWFKLSEPVGNIAPQSSKKLDLLIDSNGLSSGTHSGVILFMSNDTTADVITFPISLHLEKPEHDLVIEDYSLPTDELVILSSVDFSASIRNAGKQRERDFRVVCAVQNNGFDVFSDTVHIDDIRVNQTINVQFERFSILEEGEYDLEIKLLNFENDYNPHNNEIRLQTRVVNLMDNFEMITEQWTMTGGWGVTDKFPGYRSDNCLHVNGGVSPYQHGMDAICLFKPSLCVEEVDNVAISFWTRYNTEQNIDVCYVEVSTDLVEWIKIDSLSGIRPAWFKKEVNLKPFPDADYEQLWFRFHFISNAENSAFGVLIDDIHVDKKTSTGLPEHIESNTTIPGDWRLRQNYPNPFNMNTHIEYEMPEAGHINIRVFNLNGQQVAQIFEGYQKAGTHVVSWNGMNSSGEFIGSGIYFYRIDVDNKFSKTNKMIVIK